MTIVHPKSPFVGVETIINYRFRNHLLLREALQAASQPPLRIGKRTLHEGNKSLAHIGDAVIYLVIRRWAYAMRLTTAQAHHLTTLRGMNSSLARLGFSLHLENHINGVARERTVSPRLMATTVEAILGAVFIDGGFEGVKRVMEKLGLL